MNTKKSAPLLAAFLSLIIYFNFAGAGYISAGVSIGQEIRTQYLYTKNVTDLQDSSYDSNDYLTLLARLYIEGDIAKKMFGRLQLRYAGLYGKPSASDVYINGQYDVYINGQYFTNNALSAEKAYLRLDRLFDRPAVLTIGRQEFILGNGYLIGTDDSSGIDGLQGTYSLPYYEGKIRPFYFKIAETSDFRPNSGALIADRDIDLAGISGGAKYKWFGLTAYYINEKDNKTLVKSHQDKQVKSDKNFIGAYFEGEKNNLKSYLEYVMLNGQNAFGGYSGYAYFLKLDAKAKFGKIESKVKLFYSFGTGDKDFDDSEQDYANKAFASPYYRRQNLPENSEIGEIFNMQNPGFSNKEITGVGFEVYPVNYVNIIGNYFSYYRAFDEKIWAKEWNIGANFLYSKNLTFNILYGFLKPAVKLPNNDLPNLPTDLQSGNDAVLYKAELVFRF